MFMIANVSDRTAPEDFNEAQLDHLAQRLRLARRASGLEQRVVGRELGFAHSQLSKLEHGQGKPRRWLLRGLSDLYGVPFDWLVYGEGETPAELLEPQKAAEPALAPPAASSAQESPEGADFVRQYLVCPVCGQDALTPGGLVPHLTSDRCERPHSLAEAEELAPKATIDPQPWAFVVARYERQLEAAREAAKSDRFRLKARGHWRQLVRILRTSLNRVLDQGPDEFRIRNPRVDDPYWIPSDLTSPDWSETIRGSLNAQGLELEGEGDSEGEGTPSS